MNFPAVDKFAFQAALIRRVLGHAGLQRRVMLQLPTAGGKTRIAGKITAARVAQGDIVWFLVHRSHLIRRVCGDLSEAGIAHSVVGPGFTTDAAARVLVCSIASLRHRIGALTPPDLVFWDEAHHAAARSWKKLLEALPGAFHIGLSATPERLDGKPLGDGLFTHLEVGPQPAALEALGVLSACAYYAPNWPDLRGVKRARGDYDRAGAEAAMNLRVIVGDVIENYRKHADGRGAILFATSVKASRAMAMRFCKAGIPAAHIGAATKLEERDRIDREFRAGRIKILCNVEIFTEGYDVPDLGAVILLRPTQSLALFLQMIGRGRRFTEAYPDCVILDHAGLIFQHGDPNADREWSLTEPRAARDRRPSLESLRRCPACSRVHRGEVCPICARKGEPRDRTVEEIGGELVRVNEAPPEGWDFAERAARAHGISGDTVRDWARRGEVRQHGAFVNLADVAKLASSRLLPPEGWDFAKRAARAHGISANAVRDGAKRGEVRQQGVFVNLADVAKLASRLLPPDGWDFVNPAARAHGISANAVRDWATRGEVRQQGRFFNLADVAKLAASRLLPPEGWDFARSAAKAHGISPDAVRNAAKRGEVRRQGAFVNLADVAKLAARIVSPRKSSTAMGRPPGALVGA